jgi:hypothetical protein
MNQKVPKRFPEGNLLSINEVAKYLNIHGYTIKYWTKRKYLKCYLVNGAVYYELPKMKFINPQ